ncbi:hypothetical protein PFMALIP_03957 [Plasmodium falciparum MaliPS096_E11]|uniref:Erythrocyte membrane protein 1, PfEMP1 n=1 Tax=Plasmodium falciparum MaliPS096_E11 TaxID=1036727 RepID=A0A024WM06_PLAFA|nr:hypothetical protein PFMALIP_03957 [Plasmodium falciparum MaliPS096_E11]
MEPGRQVGGGDGIDERSAKHLLDSIGKRVHKEVKKDAETYKDDLKGNLTSSTFFVGERVSSLDPCNSDYTKHFDARGDPCKKDAKGIDVDRFSDKQGAECATSKIKDSDSNGGACAPYRRLHVCDKNMEKIATSSTKHDLLAEVCHAAKFEGQSIKTHYPKYQATYGDSDFPMCTMLARSFADIGDIIRGRDLYLGKRKKKNKTEREKLEENLQKIFEKIYKDVTSSGSNVEALKTRYENDTDNYYKLREDWWYANRETVWKAITCNDDNKLSNAKYFRATCSDTGQGPSMTPSQCRCEGAKGANASEVNIVPTYFDYVPQFLRWFEEWAEDFCRKKKKYVDIVKTYCRGNYQGDPRYCSRNGFDCEKTVNARGKVRMGKGCTDCFFACNPYVEWIDNQRKQFLKQKKIYDKEIKKYESGASGIRRQKRAAPSNINYEGYESKFYKELQSNEYGSVGKFLEKLSKDKECEKVKDGGTIDFAQEHGDNSNDKEKGTFYRSKYCQPCPICGVERKGVSGWEEKDKIEKCKSINLYKPNEDATPTPINFLYSGDRHEEINKKLEQFCTKTQNGGGGSGSQELYEDWKCYEFKDLQKDGQDGEDDPDYDKDVKEGGGLCILKKEEEKKKEEKEKKTDNDPDEIQKTFNNFFYYWVAHMLKDSIYWRTKKLEKCLQNGNKKCGNQKCEKPCECFKRWVEQKRKEWRKIVQHFKTQNIAEQTGCNPMVTLEGVLQIEFLNENTEGKSKNSLDSEELKHLREMLQQAGVVNGGGVAAFGGGCTEGGVAEQNTLMDKLLDHEEGIANKCQKDCQPPKQPPASDVSPSESDTQRDHPASEDVEDDDDEDEDDDVDDHVVDEEEEKQEVVDVVTQEEDTTSLNVCDIVNTILTGGDLGEACQQKYEYGREKFPNWKCVTPSGDTTGSSGAICVPPRRRKLYLHKIEGVDTTESLRDWFVKSAAVETFFLWDRYKKEKEKEKKEKKDAGFLLLEGEEENAQTQLNSGKIPEEFKRQMFYTLGDYRDILFSGIKDEKNGFNYIFSGDKEMSDRESKIQEQLKSFFSNSGEQPPPDKNPQTWWDDNAKYIWEGMLCALSYDTEKQNLIEGVRDKLMNCTDKKYDYKTVTFPSKSGPSSGISLSDFATVPHFIRWLEEWGEEFCRKRTHKLDIIEKECKVEANSGPRRRDGKNIETPKCSCYGEHCEHQLDADPSTDADLKCPGCGRHCRKYKKWIEKKKVEFTKQENAYNNQKVNCEKESKSAEGNNHGNEFCGTLEKTSPKATEFLKNLGPCKSQSVEANKTIFDNIGETFQHAKDCKPCSEFKINCENGSCSGGGTNVRCNDGKITAENIKNSTADIGMLVSDKSGKEFEGKGLKEACEKAGIFKGFRKDQWKCDKVCGYEVCIPEKGNGETTSGENNDQIITITALVTHWVQNFLEDYKKIKHKISQCTKSDQGSPCKKDCANKCKCVKEWITKKSAEWTNIKNRFNEQYNVNGSDNSFPVRSFLETFLVQIGAANHKDKVIKLSKFDNPCGCNAKANEQNKNGEYKDAIECMIKKLKEKAEKCKTQTSGSDCNTPPTSPTTLPDDEEPLEEEENQVKPPEICKDVIKAPTEPVVESGCVPAKTKPEETSPPAPSEEQTNQTSKPEQTPILKPEEEAPAPTSTPSPRPRIPRRAEDPLKTALMTSTLPLGIALALGSIAFLFLKFYKLYYII